MEVKWRYKKFSELSTKEFHDIVQLREQVFVVEQDCPYLDVDGKDLDAIHIIGEFAGEVVATARILSPGVSYDEVSIGRVVVAPKMRGKALGKSLTKESMEAIHKEFGEVDVRISAQTYLVDFYNGFGFQIVGEPYLEDNIPHIQMLHRAQ